MAVLLTRGLTAGGSPELGHTVCTSRAENRWSIHSDVSFSAALFWRSRVFRLAKSTVCSSWSWLKQLKTKDSSFVSGSTCRCRHWAQTSFIMHCIGELMEPMAVGWLG